MNFISTQNTKPVSFREALFSGISSEGGLFMPESFPEVTFRDFNKNSSEFDFRTLASKLLSKFISVNSLKTIVDSAFNFKVPIIQLNENLFILELFHGPTMAFKDFGARFLARTMENYLENSHEKINVLVATSGDTGSAVGNALKKIKNVNVFLLFPSGKISEIQRKQLTTINNNVIAIEVDGNFDDCQSLVKRAFSDSELKCKLNLTSANSINIARLLPQLLYYFWASLKINNFGELNFVVPSGNLGNLTAGIFARQMGLKVNKFIAALNVNDGFADYVNNGSEEQREVIPTISNAMDVGIPNNLERIKFIVKKHNLNVKNIIEAKTVDDEETLASINKCYDKYDYILDPHSAVGYSAWEQVENKKGKHVILATAHPAKFSNLYPAKIRNKIEKSTNLKKLLGKKEKSIPVKNNYENFKNLLIQNQ